MRLFFLLTLSTEQGFPAGNALLRNFQEFFKGISKDDIVCVMHHTDPDGVCSGVIAAKLVERLRGKRIDFRYNQAGSDHALSESSVEFLEKNGVTKLILTDFAADEGPAALQTLSEKMDVLIIDHHPVYNDVSSERVTVFKPQLGFSDIEPSRYCTAKLAFDAGSTLTDLSDLAWVAGIGVIGDSAWMQWPDFLRQVFSRYGFEEKEDFFETELGRISASVSAAESMSDDNSAIAFDKLYQAKGPHEVLEDSFLQDCFRKVREEMDHYLERFKELASFYPELGLVIYEIEPKYHLKISTVLGWRFPDWIIITVTPGEGFMFLSARHQRARPPVNEVLELAARNIPGAVVGGHITAAGGKIPREGYKKFLAQLLDVTRQLRETYPAQQ